MLLQLPTTLGNCDAMFQQHGTQLVDRLIRYSLKRWDALTLVLRDGRACIDNSAAERAMRPIVKPVSFVHLFFKYQKHWKLNVGSDVTRTPFTPAASHHRRRVQVGGTDLERRARNNLLGAKNTRLD